MALPTPLHPAQAEATAIKAEFNTGPHEGMVLLVAKDDPNLAGAIASREVVIPGPISQDMVAVGQDTVDGGQDTVPEEPPVSDPPDDDTI